MRSRESWHGNSLFLRRAFVVTQPALRAISQPLFILCSDVFIACLAVLMALSLAPNRYAAWDFSKACTRFQSVEVSWCLIGPLCALAHENKSLSARVRAVVFLIPSTRVQNCRVSHYYWLRQKELASKTAGWSVSRGRLREIFSFIYL